MNLNDTTVLVTGAAKRIGREISISLAKRGANVIIHYKSSKDEAEMLHEDLSKLGVKAPLLQANLSNRSELEELIPEAIQKLGELDCLVNNAAIFPRKSLEELDFGELLNSIKINTWAPFYLTRSFIELSENGRIVNLLDTRIAGYDWEHSGYYMSKVLLARITKMMALKYAPKFIVNGVAPGLILPPEGKDEKYLEAKMDRVPLKKSGNENDVAKAVIYLLRSNSITGQIIYVDGGRNLLHELEG